MAGHNQNLVKTLDRIDNLLSTELKRVDELVLKSTDVDKIAGALSEIEQRIQYLKEGVAGNYAARELAKAEKKLNI